MKPYAWHYFRRLSVIIIVAVLFSVQALGPVGRLVRAEANQPSTCPSVTLADPEQKHLSLSMDGQWAAFSTDRRLVSQDTNSLAEVYVYDRITDTFEWIPASSTGRAEACPAYAASISGDGRLVAFISAATPAGTATSRLYLHDRLTGSTEGIGSSFQGVPILSIQAAPALSIDGRYIAFSATFGQTDPGSAAVYVYDRYFRYLRLVSTGPEGQSLAADGSRPSLSADGRFVAFAAFSLPSLITRLYVFDLKTGQAELASVNATGEPADGTSTNPSLSSDGRFLAFRSQARNLTSLPSSAPDQNVYVRDRLAGSVLWVPVHTAAPFTGDGSPYSPSISGDGRLVAFITALPIVPEDNQPCPDDYRPSPCRDVYLYDALNGSMKLASAGGSGKTSFYNPALSINGKVLGFLSYSAVAMDGGVPAADPAFYLQTSDAIQPRLALEPPGVAAPGSEFRLAVENFPPGASITLSANGNSLGVATAGAEGKVIIKIQTQDAGAGNYWIVAEAGSFARVPALLTLDPAAGSLQVAENLPTFQIPASVSGLKAANFIPSVQRSVPTWITRGAAGQTDSNVGFQLRNVTDTPASAWIALFNPNGSIALLADTPVSPNAKRTFYPLENIGAPYRSAPLGFDGSAVIYSNQELVTSVNWRGSDVAGDYLSYTASYLALNHVAPTASLPLLMKQNYGFSTRISIQNLGTTPADLTVRYSSGATETARGILPGAAAVFDQERNPDLSNGWVGSAVASSSSGGAVAAAVLELGPTTVFAYSGFPFGSAAPVFPIFQANHYGYVSGLNLQNNAATASTVTVEYVPGEGWPGTPCRETRTVPSKGSSNFGLYVFTSFLDFDPNSLVSEDCSPGQTFVGSARVIANSAGAELFGIANQLNLAEAKGAAYGGLDPGSATRQVVFPLVMDRNYGFFTGLNVMNADVTGLPAGAVTCIVQGDARSGPLTRSFISPAIPPGGSWKLVNHPGEPGEIADLFVGSAICSGPQGSRLLGVLNQVRNGVQKDTFMVYEGFNP